MRRKDREVTDISRINELVSGCKVCRMAMCDGTKPYVVALNFGYTFEDEVFTFYFHSAREGRKLDILKANPAVCLELDQAGQVVESASPCAFGYEFASIIAEGNVEFIHDDMEKAAALNHITRHMAGQEFDFTPQMVCSVCVYKVKVTSLSCKIR